MNKSYIEWIDYYENATKEDVIQDMMLDINSIKEKDKEIERLKEELKYTIPIVEHNKTITKHLKEIERLTNIINKAIEYIWSKKYEYGDLEEDNEDFDIDVYELIKILEGDSSNE